MEFLRFDSIKHDGGEYLDGVPEHSKEDYVVILEKLDGTNVSVTSEYVSGRNKPIIVEKGKKDRTRGWFPFGSKLQKHELMKDYIFFGEWLVFHTVEYKEKYLRNFYLFAAVNKKTKKEISWAKLKEFSLELGVPTPPLIYEGLYSGIEQKIESIVGDSFMSLEENHGEGIVIWNQDRKFRTKKVGDKFSERHRMSFKEEKLQTLKDSEIWALEYGTPARIRKCMHKLIEEEIILEENLLYCHFQSIFKTLLEFTYEDMVSESTLPPRFEEKAAKKTLTKNVIKVMHEFLEKEV